MKKKSLYFTKSINYEHNNIYTDKTKLREEMYIKKVIIIQSTFRGYKISKAVRLKKMSQILISKNFRRYKQLHRIQQIKRSIHILVPKIKLFISYLIIKEHKDLKDFIYKIVYGAFEKIILKEKIEKSIKINAVCRRFLFHLNHPKLIAQIKKTLNLKKLIKSAYVISLYEIRR